MGLTMWIPSIPSITSCFRKMKKLKGHKINGRFWNISVLEIENIRKSPVSCFLILERC